MSKETMGGTNSKEGFIDPFSNLESLRIASPVPTIRLMKELTSVRTERPDKKVFFRVRPGEDNQLDCCMLESSRDEGMYLVMGECIQDLESEIIPIKLLQYQTRGGDIGLWPIKLPRSESRSNRWAESAMSAADIAQRSWIRLIPNIESGCYDVYLPEGGFQDPVWPDKPFSDYIRLAFRDRVISTIDHPVVKKLRGLL